MDDCYRNGQQAVELATRANELSNWQNADYLDTLAAAYAEAGDFYAASQYEVKAIELAPSPLEGAKERLYHYRGHKAYRSRTRNIENEVRDRMMTQ